MKTTLKSFLLFTLLLAACGRTTDSEPAYLDPSLPAETRVEDLLLRMTLEEKVGQMCQYVGIEHILDAERRRNENLAQNEDAYAFYPGLGTADLERLVTEGRIGSFLHVVSPAEANRLQTLARQSRLKIPLLIGIDAIHGNGMVSGCTVYPSQMGMSCTWSPALVEEAARQTALEMRATGSQWAFSPNLDIARDARWGRTGETFGEDPLLVAEMGAAMIRGLQGDDLKGGVLACAKHLVGGSEPINGLNVAPTDLSERTLLEVYLPPYKAAVEAGACTFMPAHNEINGVPCHAHRYLMNDLVREAWGFEGFYVSDFLDIERLAEVHRVAASQKEAVYKTVRAGMDMHMHGPGFAEPLLELVREGKISEKRIDESVRRILSAKFRLGLFEQPLADTAAMASQVFTEEHRAHSLDMARKSIVLLKNENGILPLDAKKYRKILVTGPNADSQSLLGDWSLLQPDDRVTTIVEGMREQSPEGVRIDFLDMGTSIPGMKREKVEEAARIASGYDLVVLCLGECSLRYRGRDQTAGENVDRDDIRLPGLQPRLLEAVHRSGTPVVGVVVNARPLDFTYMKEHIPAIVEAWEPGSFGGQAVAEILWGKVNPSGKLTVSFPRNVGQIPVFYNRKPSQYVRRYFRSPHGAVYEFGEGLSYTTYAYTGLKIDRTTVEADETVTVSVDVQNTGDRAGEEIVQLYLNAPVSDVTRPIKELKGFRRIALEPGEKRTVTFTLTPEMMETYDLYLNRSVEPGLFRVLIGPSSRTSDLLEGSFEVI
ncbi:glycoside hydrolase family 3 N-terminal domain-containing protein [Gallalistipes aquisgranensis]|uniref:glycoside hydrolase family 3 N-terminal domain-containing protein n=1 Tax=Gallalistipes aquisgranensis TaxID=2779358 RepID=UPI001CF85030|nr:glycoside hydrolase family 3 N-terminal domain-containing protein [Gallalistipes aquisgranensis]MBE5034220.1 glycoside hydrolase family 3 C-terminal domain-containing protein [Gallalistipes aquisgranensis]